MKFTSFNKAFTLACIATIALPAVSFASTDTTTSSILPFMSSEQSIIHAEYHAVTEASKYSLSNITPSNYRILQEEFTPEEILALNEMVTESDINQIVSMIDATRSVDYGSPGATLNPRPTLEAFASWQPNGCTASPDSIGKANFRPACNNHDACYASFSPVSRADCDLFFHSQLYTECNRVYTGIKRTACHRIADTYYNFVRAFGWKFYKGTGAG